MIAVLLEEFPNRFVEKFLLKPSGVFIVEPLGFLENATFENNHSHTEHFIFEQVLLTQNLSGNEVLEEFRTEIQGLLLEEVRKLNFFRRPWIRESVHNDWISLFSQRYERRTDVSVYPLVLHEVGGDFEQPL